MQITTSNSAIANMIALINTSSGTSLAETDVTFGAPSDFTPSSGNNNTQVTVSAAADSDFTGSVDINYQRLDLDTLTTNAGLTLEFTLTGSTTIADIKSAIVSQLDVVPDEVELDTDTVPTVAQGSTATINLQAIAAGSLLYTGSTAITIHPQKEAMSDAVTTTDMNGFDYPA